MRAGWRTRTRQALLSWPTALVPWLPAAVVAWQIAYGVRWQAVTTADPEAVRD
jgi:hypothetical protein